MSKILLIASAVLLLISSGLSFVNKGKLTDSLNDARAAHTDATSARADANKTHVALTKAQTDAKAAIEKADTAQQQYTAAQGQVTDLNAKLTAAQGGLDTAQKQMVDLQKQLSDINKTNDGKQVDPGAIAQQINDLKRDGEEKQVVIDGLKDNLKTAQNQVAALAKAETDRQQGIAVRGLRGKVLAVDRNWNFVVVSLGLRNGVNNKTTMIVQRGGELVGKVRITSVEPSQSIADIIPNSVPQGVTVQAGDTVVFPSGT